MKIQELSIDLETYSDVDISKCGVYKYAESISSVMGRTPDWMPNILIRGDGYDTKFYKKD